MIKKSLGYAWSVRHEFTKYAVVGFSGFFLDMGLLIFSKTVLNMNATISVAIILCIVMVYNFLLNKYWSFKNHAMPHKQFVRYAILAAWNYIFGVAMMYIFNELLEFDYRLVRIAAIGIAVGWNFFLYKYWVYK